MKSVKGSYFSGYLEIQVIGEQPEHFLHKCSNNGIMLWNIRKQAANQCTAMVQLRDIQAIKKLRFGTPYKISFNKKYGIPFLNKRLKKQKPLLFGLLFSVLLFIMLTNMVWQVTITGVHEELENKIHERLTSYGVHPGAFSFTVASPNQIQQLLLEDVPELLWVGVEKRGTSFYLEGVEKLIIIDEEAKSPRHLVADKSGVIKSMYVKRGFPEVLVNDFVEKGQVLVSGQIEKLDMSTDNEESDSYEFVAAEGDVLATTWYRAEVTVPIETEQVLLTGNVEKSYQIGIGSKTLPIWPWRKEEFTSAVQDIEVKEFNIFGWQLPVSFIREKSYESYLENRERTREEAIQVGIEQAKMDLLRQLGKEAKIITEKVLHETIDHGKVKLSLYITVEENIAIEYPISQGD